MSVPLYTKSMQITLPQVKMAKLKTLCGSGLGAGAEIRCWLDRDLPHFSASYLSMPFDALPAKLMLRITQLQWSMLQTVARKHHTYPARIARQIIENRLRDAV